MSIKALQEYTRYSKYAKYLSEKKRRETWEEQVNRVFDMHEEKLGDKIEGIREEFNLAKEMVLKKRLLGSQRALQFGGDAVLNHNAKIYNCTASYCDRPRFFQEALYLLLEGCGVGFSVQTHHVAKLPDIVSRNKGNKIYTVEDSIEGWADCLGVLMSSYFAENQPFPEYFGYEVEFDYSNIRPKGAPISWGGKAPGPDGLSKAIEKIVDLFENCLKTGDRLRTIDAYDIVMHSADSVISGGHRRSATICLFSPDDELMATAKTGSWFMENPQRGRSNNSALLVRNKTTPEQFSNLMKSVKEFGEPGFVWADDTEVLFNPCSEISLRGYDAEGNSGFEFCNLCEINMKKATTRELFLEVCRSAAVLGTIQASYDSFPYLGKVTEDIVKREALLGVSMTGMMDTPEIAFNPELQREAAEIIKSVNKEISSKIGINQAARTTAVKPAGTTSCILGSSSGIHLHHSKRYFRRVQSNKMEFPAYYFKLHNPSAVESSVWSANGTDEVITFLCEVPPGAKTKNQMTAIEFLDHVKLTQQNWIEYGTNEHLSVVPYLRHNVSNTITVKEHEWDDVEQYIYENRNLFAGVSLLPFSGDLDYPQAPFSSVLDERELVKTYGEGSLFASGLIVDGLHAFNDNLWTACDCALGIGEKLDQVDKPEEPYMPHKNGYTDKEWAFKMAEYADRLKSYHENKENYDILEKKKDWVRRFKQFAQRYVESNERKCTHMLKHVYNRKVWLDLSREYQEVDWSMAVEDDYAVDVGSIGADACAGKVNCDAGDLGAAIEEGKKKVS